MLESGLGDLLHTLEEAVYLYNREAAWDGERRPSLRHPNPAVPLWRIVMGWQPYHDLTTEIGVPLASYGPSGYVFKYQQGTRHVIYQGRSSDGSGDGKIHELYWNNAGWHHHDLTAATDAPLATNSWGPSSYAFELQRTQHVVYQGRLRDGSADGHIHELYWNNAGWHHHDLTAATDAPLAISNPVGYEFSIGDIGHQCVAYWGQNDHHIHELRWDGGDGKWHHLDLNERTEVGILAITRPSAYVFRTLVQRHVLHVGTDSHIHWLYWEPSAGDWHYAGDLTAATGAPLPNEEPTGFAFDAEGTQFVHYRGTDGHIHQLSWDSNAGWHHFDLTAHVGGPLSACRPTGYLFPHENTLHVVYTGQEDGHIYEFLRDSRWHPPNDLTIATGEAPSAIRLGGGLDVPAGYVGLKRNMSSSLQTTTISLNSGGSPAKGDGGHG
jgi:hypothetical protein